MDPGIFSDKGTDNLCFGQFFQKECTGASPAPPLKSIIGLVVLGLSYGELIFKDKRVIEMKYVLTCITVFDNLTMLFLKLKKKQNNYHSLNHLQS